MPSPPLGSISPCPYLLVLINIVCLQNNIIVHYHTNHLFSMRQPLLNELNCLSCHFLLDGVQAGVGVASMKGHHHKSLKTC